MKALPIVASQAQSLLAPLTRFSHLALAVSGGPDSLALMHLAARWQRELAAGPSLSVLTVDHGLRQGSRAEAELVGSVASELGLPHAILSWEKCEARSTSVQARARTARYDLMAAFCHANDIPALVTAHHLDDQAETFLMRLKRGSGLDGLAAIPERGEWAGIAILRPLLEIPKARLVATVEAAGIAFASDPSNEDQRFERARLRQSADALAKLELTPEALALSARRLRRAREALDAAARDFVAAHSELSEAGYALVGRDAIFAAPQEIALRALSQLVGAVGGSEEPVRLAKLEALLAALQAHLDRAHTLGRCRIQPFKGRLGVFREMRGSGLPIARLSPGERMLWDNRFRIELGAEERAPIVVRALGESGLRELRDRCDWPASLPRLASRALPACWRGDVLLGLPELGLAGAGGPSGIDCRASFVSALRSDGAGERARAQPVEKACTSLR